MTAGSTRLVLSRDYLLTFQGKDVLLTFSKHLGEALAQACELDRDLARAAQIMRYHMIEDVQWISYRMPTGLRDTHATCLSHYDLGSSQYQAPVLKHNTDGH